eukprot:5323003-Pyramimonas_sp.AAC.1
MSGATSTRTAAAHEAVQRQEGGARDRRWRHQEAVRQHQVRVLRSAWEAQSRLQLHGRAQPR